MVQGTVSNSYTTTDDQYTFTVKRIAQLQKLLSVVDPKLVNKFITEIRYSVTTYHLHQHEANHNKKVKSHEIFFSKLNDKAHQLGRFTLQLSELVSAAPADLLTEAREADKTIDKIHGNLVDLCLTIDKLSQQKSNFYHDTQSTVKDIYNAYCNVFNTKPTGRSFLNIKHVQPMTAVKDLLVPVVEILIVKDHQRCASLVKTAIKLGK